MTREPKDLFYIGAPFGLVCTEHPESQPGNPTPPVTAN